MDEENVEDILKSEYPELLCSEELFSEELVDYHWPLELYFSENSSEILMEELLIRSLGNRPIEFYNPYLYPIQDQEIKTDNWFHG